MKFKEFLLLESDVVFRQMWNNAIDLTDNFIGQSVPPYTIPDETLRSNKPFRFKLRSIDGYELWHFSYGATREEDFYVVLKDGLAYTYGYSVTNFDAYDAYDDGDYDRNYYVIDAWHKRYISISEGRRLSGFYDRLYELQHDTVLLTLHSNPEIQKELRQKISDKNPLLRCMKQYIQAIKDAN